LPEPAVPVLSLTLALALAMPPSGAQSESEVYRVTLIRAAPGGLLQLIDLLGSRMAVYDAAGEERPIVLRHRQGDQWDLFVLTPVGSLAEYFSAERVSRHADAAESIGMSEDAFEQGVRDLTSWRQDLFVEGPPAELARAVIDAGTFFHVEMFIALPGMYAELVQERKMENAYSAALGRPQPMIFTRLIGAEWDVFTLGVYRDLAHYAESDAIPADEAEAAATAAGFEGREYIGSYMRTLILEHRDTLMGREM
jgi:hypothetical protein